MDVARTIRQGGCATLVAALWMSFAGPAAVADPGVNLTAAVEKALTRCPAVQSDSLVERAAQLALHETDDYITHQSAYVPFTDPLPALKAIGYQGDKAVLFSGYGTNEADSIKGLLMQGAPSFSRCDYQHFGLAALYNSEQDYYLTSLVLAA